jgi:ATP-dependent protease HslVU (ClpYQ) peptidase subunit
VARCACRGAGAVATQHLDARQIAEEAMKIAADICIYTNGISPSKSCNRDWHDGHFSS